MICDRLLYFDRYKTVEFGSISIRSGLASTIATNIAIYRSYKWLHYIDDGRNNYYSDELPVAFRLSL